MAESIVFNNATYIIPDVGESNWGQNLTNYFVAIPQGAYQASGGTMPLTADLSFGTNFGLFAKYLTTETANPASTGVLRLANTDGINWRNAANNANLPLSVDTSNNLLWNGDILATASASPVLSITGTANEITASASTGNVTLSVPVTFIAPGSIQATSTLKGTAVIAAATTNQIILGTTNTITLSSTAPASSRTYTIPDAGGAANVVLDAGNYTIAGTWAFSNTITMGSSKGIIFTDNSTNAVTMKATNSTTSWTLNLPTTHGSSNQFLQTDGSGNTSWQNGGAGTVTSGAAGNLTLYPTASASVGDTYVQNAKNITIGIATQASRSANLAITIPNPGNAITAANVVLDVGNYTLPGAYAFTGISTFSAGAGAITMSSSTIAMGANKITGLANGTASTDGAAFGQIKYLQAVQALSSTNVSTTSSTFTAATNQAVTIVPTSASNRIKVTVSTIYTGVTGGIAVTIKRGPTELSGVANGFSLLQTGGGNFSQCSFSYIDSPATTSSTVYAVFFRSDDNTTSVQIGRTDVVSSIIAEEIV